MRMYPDDWRVRLTTGVMVGVCMGATMVLGPVVGIHGFWPGMLAITGAVFLGTVLGGRIGRRWFGSSAGGPADPPPQA